MRAIAVDSTPGTHVVHLEAIGPDGSARAHYATNVKLRNGVGQISIPTALNDPKGRWELEVRDVASGLTGEVAVQLR